MPTAADFGPAYFDTYCHTEDYSTVYQNFTFKPDVLAACLRHLKHKPKSALDLGAATGVLLRDMQAAIPSLRRLEGIEISEYAVAQRVVSDIHLGNVMDAARLLSVDTGVRPTFDLVLSNVAVYLSEAELGEFLRMVRNDLLAANGLFVFTCFNSPFDAYTAYEGDGFSRQPGDVAPILSRPRMWWYEQVVRAGFAQVGDLEASMVFKLADPEPNFSVLGDVATVRVEYPTSRRWRNEVNPMTLVCGEHRMAITLDQERKLWFELDRNWRKDDDAAIRALAAMVNYLHTGAQTIRTVELSRKRYTFVPFMFTHDLGEGAGYQLISEYQYL